MPGSKRMALPGLPEASWLPHLEEGLHTFHLAMKVLPACSVNVGQELGFCDPKPSAEGLVVQLRDTLRERLELYRDARAASSISFTMSLYIVPCSCLATRALQGNCYICMYGKDPPSLHRGKQVWWGRQSHL